MAIRPHPTKGKDWWQIVISQGRGKKQKLYTYQGTRAEALSFEADLRGIPSYAAEQKLLDILGRFLDWYHLHRAPRSAQDAESTLPRVIDRIGNKHVSLLRQADYTRYKQIRLADDVTRRTVNIELTKLRALLNYASEELGLQIGDMPKLYTKKQTQPPSIVPLTPNEIARLLTELQGDKKTIAMLYAHCALRRNEALHLQAKHIDFESGLIYVTGKGGKHRIVPIIGDELRQQLTQACIHFPKMKRGKQIDPADTERNKRPDEYLFICARTGKPYLNIKKSLKAAADRAGISKPIWNHLLRHSGATAGIQAGVDIRSLQTLLGHSDIRDTERYTHMAASVIHSAGDKLSALHNTARKQTSDMSDIKIAKKDR